MTSTASAETSTIFALSSGHGKAGVAVIRVSGPAAADVLGRMAAPCPKPRQAAFRRIVDPQSGELLDAALVLYFKTPSSETGEDIAELQLHGSPAVVRRVLQALGTIPGCRLAEPGEFARRAFLNAKIDLTAAEGLADLIDAETEAQRRQALAQAGGAFRKLCDVWRDALSEARALAEAAIDFSDEGDVAADALAKARESIRLVLADIERHLDDRHRGEIVRDGFRIVIAGPPNVGKSSLLNALARRDVAIVSPEPGTTRDVLEVHLDLGGYAVIVADTAGIRDAPGIVEQEGIRRAHERARNADLVLWMVDATAPAWLPPAELSAQAASVLPILNKVDCVADIRQAVSASRCDDGLALQPLAISAMTGAGLGDLLARLSTIIGQRLEGAAGEVLPTQARHRAALSDCMSALRRASAEPGIAPELFAEELRLASDALGRITGKVDAETVLGLIFGRFCIGK